MAAEIKLRTKFLFKLLLRLVNPDIVCDIGSLDASEAIWFAKLLPKSKVILFEANPINFAAIQQNPEVLNCDIQSVAKAVWSQNEKLHFFIEEAEIISGKDEHLPGISSTRPRKNLEESGGGRSVEIEAVRLDDFINSLVPVPLSIALWIDVEGAAYEVLEGMRGISEKVVLVHVEVETKEFWQGQKLKSDVLNLACSLGFEIVARGRIEEQHDLVLINRKFLGAYPKLVPFLVAVVRLLTLDLRTVPIIRLVTRIRDVFH